MFFGILMFILYFLSSCFLHLAQQFDQQVYYTMTVLDLSAAFSLGPYFCLVSIVTLRGFITITEFFFFLS